MRSFVVAIVIIIGSGFSGNDESSETFSLELVVPATKVFADRTAEDIIVTIAKQVW
jgi:hypothetical protein